MLNETVSEMKSNFDKLRNEKDGWQIAICYATSKQFLYFCELNTPKRAEIVDKKK